MFRAKTQARSLFFVSVATFFSLSVWFSTNAISGALELEKSVDESSIALLTIAVQLGFVFGTLVIAVTNLSDLLNARTLFAVSAVLAAVTNLLVIPIESTPLLIAARFATGAFLGGVYPPAMKGNFWLVHERQGIRARNYGWSFDDRVWLAAPTPICVLRELASCDHWQFNLGDNRRADP